MITFIDAIVNHQENLVPLCMESHRYTKTDGITLAYYYEYPHSFGNPFRNINFPIAVTMSFYSAKTNGPDTGSCFTRWGDYVGMMLSYSEINTRADSLEIICNTYAGQDCPVDAPESCTSFCCVQTACENFCRPFYEESLAEILNSATMDAAGVGLICGGLSKGGSYLYYGVDANDVTLSPLKYSGAKDYFEYFTKGDKTISEVGKEPVADLSTEQGIELADFSAAEIVPEAAVGGTDVAAVGGTDAVVSGTVETGADITAELATFGALEATSDAIPVIGAAVGVVIAIGFGIMMGIQMRNKKKQHCQNYQQYCIATDASGSC